MNILHFCHDEKQIPFVQRLFEAAAPGCNTYRIWGPRPGQPTKHARLGPRDQLVPKSYWYSTRMRHDVRQSDIVIVHYLTFIFAKAIQAATPRQMVVWGAWGGDYYSLMPGIGAALRLPLSMRIDDLAASKRRTRPREAVKRILRSPITWLEQLDTRSWPERTLPKIDWFSGPEVIRQQLAHHHPGFRAQHRPCGYYSTDEMPDPQPNGPVGTDILLGNSATAPNNHAEALLSLSRLELAGRRIIVPLSYGGADYADEVCRLGSRLFGSSFVPLRDFLPLQEYLALTQGCSTVIMNHIRAQAFGNIAASLYAGAHVLLRPENPLYDLLRSWGVTVSAWNDSPASDLLDALDTNGRESNRRIIHERLGFESMVRRVQTLLESRDSQVCDALPAPERSRRMSERVLHAYNRLIERRFNLGGVR